ncbi:hypothetical protein BCV70DRAFT_238510 [Testicularia cyperi]|uniref:Uncharacterized protein n=1 Tax=Testicularia cyperi TaxID=1882483 RepID=A0A317XKP9_9BASI|nr:hypothetical protein BCV70DRAFT_238510 [Testicularia cyperi]
MSIRVGIPGLISTLCGIFAPVRRRARQTLPSTQPRTIATSWVILAASLRVSTVTGQSTTQSRVRSIRPPMRTSTNTTGSSRSSSMTSRRPTTTASRSGVPTRSCMSQTPTLTISSSTALTSVPSTISTTSSTAPRRFRGPMPFSGSFNTSTSLALAICTDWCCNRLGFHVLAHTSHFPFHFVFLSN